MLSFLLVPLYTDVLPVREYGHFSIIISWIVLFNVILAYGMETAFFRFFHKEKDKGLVVSTSAVSIIFTTVLFFLIAYVFSSQLSILSGINEEFIVYTI